MSTSSTTIPSFDNLTLDPSGPKGNTWGLFGKDNHLGMLNLLTPDVVKQAASEEIKDGVRFALDWQLNALHKPAFGRQSFEHKIVPKTPRFVNDDVLVLNTQSSSQWDGFRHYGIYLLYFTSPVFVVHGLVKCLIFVFDDDYKMDWLANYGFNQVTNRTNYFTMEQRKRLSRVLTLLELTVRYHVFLSSSLDV